MVVNFICCKKSEQNWPRNENNNANNNGKDIIKLFDIISVAILNVENVVKMWSMFTFEG